MDRPRAEGRDMKAEAACLPGHPGFDVYSFLKFLYISRPTCIDFRGFFVLKPAKSQVQDQVHGHEIEVDGIRSYVAV